MGTMNRRSLLGSLLLLLGYSFVQAILTPTTTPEHIIESQLTALRQNNMPGVFEFASPGNKAQLGGSLDRFTQMVNSGPYRFLVGHRKADILLASNLAASKQYLIRVMPDDYPNTSIVEFWWSLSRVRSGPNEGCYMVDAVIPNT
jgi:hypothetical protein